MTNSSTYTTPVVAGTQSMFSKSKEQLAGFVAAGGDEAVVAQAEINRRIANKGVPKAIKLAVTNANTSKTKTKKRKSKSTTTVAKTESASRKRVTDPVKVAANDAFKAASLNHPAFPGTAGFAASKFLKAEYKRLADFASASGVEFKLDPSELIPTAVEAAGPAVEEWAKTHVSKVKEFAPAS